MKKILFILSFLAILSCGSSKVIDEEDVFYPHTKNLVFKSGTNEFVSDFTKEISTISKIIKNKSSDFSFEISGHTDSVGDKDLNLALSQKRAEKVRELLIAEGCKSSRLIAKGYGETKPLSSNRTKEGRKINRRVEVVVFKKTSN